MQQWLDEAPSNIALIKYMGKKNTKENLPDNPSLSYTLDNLITKVSLETSKGPIDCWEPLQTSGMSEITLPANSQIRFLNHLAVLKKQFNYNGSFIVRSNNNFPHSSGIASSASSFAALTKCAVKALSELTNTKLPTTENQASLSRLGSGSSCRSFFTPWVIWDDEKVEKITLPYNQLTHEVIIISNEVKEISSSKAHALVQTSKLYKDRSTRARANLKLLLNAFKDEKWADAYQICWQEFQDMHQLFSSCDKPFSYISDTSKKVLNQLQELWQQEQDGPIITMDAGPNIHLLYRADQLEMANKFRQKHLIGKFDVL
jgi:diphosphomevalonate decarboxylase